MERGSCVKILNEVLRVIDVLEREYDPDKRASIRVALKKEVREHLDDIQNGKER